MLKDVKSHGSELMGSRWDILVLQFIDVDSDGDVEHIV